MVQCCSSAGTCDSSYSSAPPDQEPRPPDPPLQLHPCVGLWFETRQPLQLLPRGGVRLPECPTRNGNSASSAREGPGEVLYSADRGATEGHIPPAACWPLRLHLGGVQHLPLSSKGTSGRLSCTGEDGGPNRNGGEPGSRSCS
jgi:hypothetical protein